MTRRDHMDPAFAAGLEGELEARSDRVRRRATTGGLGVRWQAVIAVAVAALVIAASAVALVVAPRSAPADGSHPSPDASHRIGTLSWSDAIEVAPTVLRVTASPYAVHSSTPNCGASAARPQVTETGSSISVTMIGYDDDFERQISPDQDVICAAVALPSISVDVQLSRPLAGRSLIDGVTGKRHAVLDPASIPEPGALPAGFLERPASWDEQNDVATRVWATDTKAKGSYLDFTVSVGSQHGVFLHRLGQQTGTTTVHGHAANIWVSASSYDWAAHVTWSVDGRIVDVGTHGNLRNHRSVAELERVAESTPDP